MSDETCSCTETEVEQTTRTTDQSEVVTSATERWVDEQPVGEATLPGDVSAVMSDFYSVASVETLDDFVVATRADTGDSAITVSQLCHVDGDSTHRASTPSETYDFRCFYDGVALSHLVEEPVEITTESPGGRAITVEATPDGGIETTPSGAVMSLGIASDAAAAVDGDAPDPTAVYEAICPYVKAFPSREAYHAWAAGTDAATVGLPVAAGVPIAAALTEGPSDDR